MHDKKCRVYLLSLMTNQLWKEIRAQPCLLSYFQEVSQKNVGSELELLDELLDENWMVYIPIYHIQNINSEHEYFHLHRMNLTSRMCCFFTGFLILFIQVELKCIIPSILYPEWLVTKSFDPHSCVLARMTEQGSSLCIIILVTSNGMSNWHHKKIFFFYTIVTRRY